MFLYWCYRTVMRLHYDIYVEIESWGFVVIVILIFIVWDGYFFHLHLGCVCLLLLNSLLYHIIGILLGIYLGLEIDLVCSGVSLLLVCSLRGGRAFLLSVRITCLCRRYFKGRLSFGRFVGCLFIYYCEQLAYSNFS